MIVNFLFNLLGINWFLGLFGLTLKPLEDLEYPKHVDGDEKNTEHKRKLVQMDSSEDIESQANLKKLCKKDIEDEDDFCL